MKDLEYYVMRVLLVKKAWNVKDTKYSFKRNVVEFKESICYEEDEKRQTNFNCFKETNSSKLTKPGKPSKVVIFEMEDKSQYTLLT